MKVVRQRYLQSGALSARAIGALFILPFAAGLLIWPLGTMLLTTLLIVMAAREAAPIVGAIVGGASTSWSAALLLVPLLSVASLGPLGAFGLMTLALLALITTQLVRALRVRRGSITPIVRSLFGTLATAVWLSPLTLLPLFGLLGASSPAPWIAWLLAVVWSADTGAYLIGRRFGRRKLAPRISPRKSIEGSIGGLILATAAGTLTAIDWLHAPLLWALVASGLVAIAAEVGDLVESLFKRAAGIHTSSTVIPGHGGLLDRVDSLLLAAPVALIAAVVLMLPQLSLVD